MLLYGFLIKKQLFWVISFTGLIHPGLKSDGVCSVKVIARHAKQEDGEEE